MMDVPGSGQNSNTFKCRTMQRHHAEVVEGFSVEEMQCIAMQQRSVQKYNATNAMQQMCNAMESGGIVLW